ncbi:MAG: protein arginine kinase [Dethiobacteria bacterium]|jgi:protein arginine kinase
MSEKEKPISDKTKYEGKIPLEEIFEGDSEENKLEQQRRGNITSKWMAATGPEADMVISSRVRLARNIRGFPFPSLASDEQREKTLQLAGDVLQKEEALSDFRVLELGSLPPVYRQVLVEKHLISPLMAKEARFSALMFREDETVSVMVNEEDHFRIQCLLPGLQLEKAWEEASRYDDLLEAHIEYAFHENYGYLTACPTNVGTGLRVSVMLHLPALVITEQIKRILAAIYQVGLAVRGFYGEGTEMSGSLFQVSNQITLGQTEEEIWQNLYGVTRQLISQEKKAREHLLNKGRERLADRAGRALGTLKYARLISSKEAMQLLSDIRLGVGLGLIKGISVKTLNELLILTRPGCLQYLKGRTLNSYERNLERAAQIQKYLSRNEQQNK